MTDTPESRLCPQGHTNPAGQAVCRVCGKRVGPRAGRPITHAPSTFQNSADEMHYQAAQFRMFFNVFAVLTVIGAVVIGYASAQETVCSSVSFSCDTTTDGAVFVGATLGSFVAGILLVLPLRGIAFILSGVGRVLDSNDPDLQA